jgi:hypothetical protein
MAQKVCLNPDCKSVYHVSSDEFDDSMGCCSFDCWEKVYCHEPPVEIFENFIIESIK